MAPLLVTLVLLPRPVLSGVEQTVDAGAAFKVHYTLSGEDALFHGPLDVDPKNGVPDDADAVASGVQQVYRSSVTDGGMRPPLSDGARGGDGRIDVYVRKLDGPRGYAHVEETGMAPATSAWLEVDPRTALQSAARLGAAAGHEAHHAIQFAYSPAVDDWMKEATATWVEVTLFSLHMEEVDHWSALATHPDLPLDYADGVREYNMMGFISYLVQLHPLERAMALHRLWTTIVERGNTFDAIVEYAGMPGALVMVSWGQYLGQQATLRSSFVAPALRQELALPPWSLRVVILDQPDCWRAGDIVETDGSVALGVSTGGSTLYEAGMHPFDESLYGRILIFGRGPAGPGPALILTAPEGRGPGCFGGGGPDAAPPVSPPRDEPGCGRCSAGPGRAPSPDALLLALVVLARIRRPRRR